MPIRDLPATPAAVDPLNSAAQQGARDRQARLARPAGTLGRLEELAVWLAGVQGRCPPLPPRQPTVVVFAGDRGDARTGGSAYPPAVTGELVANVLAGGAAVNVLARLVGATVRVVDLAVDGEVPGATTQTTRHKVRRSSGRIDLEDALTTEEAERAFAAGTTIADEEVDAGADLLVPGDLGIGNTTAAAVLVAAVTGAEPAAVVGHGTGIDDAAWMRRTAVVRDALRRARGRAGDPLALLAAVAGADLAAMTGFLIQAAVRRTPVLLDGVVSAATALVAERIAPAAVDWWMAGSRSTEPAQSLALDRLGLRPLLDLGLRMDDGTAALLALPLINAAAATLAEVAASDSTDGGDCDHDG